MECPPDGGHYFLTDLLDYFRLVKLFFLSAHTDNQLPPFSVLIANGACQVLFRHVTTTTYANYPDTLSTECL